MFHKIKDVAYVPDYKLSIQFAEGITKIYDLNILMEKIDAFKIFKPVSPLFSGWNCVENKLF